MVTYEIDITFLGKTQDLCNPNENCLKGAHPTQRGPLLTSVDSENLFSLFKGYS